MFTYIQVILGGVCGFATPPPPEPTARHNLAQECRYSSASLGVSKVLYFCSKYLLMRAMSSGEKWDIKKLCWLITEFMVNNYSVFRFSNIGTSLPQYICQFLLEIFRIYPKATCWTFPKIKEIIHSSIGLIKYFLVKFAKSITEYIPV